MGKNNKKNKGIAEANAEAELIITDGAVRALLDKIDEKDMNLPFERKLHLRRLRVFP